MWLLALSCGLMVGVAFGLTGVGSVFAVPALVYLLGVGPHQAVCVSMVAVLTLAALNTILRWRGKEIDLRIGLIMASTGVLGAPVGAWIGRFLSARGLMMVFAAFVVFIALRLVFRGEETETNATSTEPREGARWPALGFAGIATGLLAGLLGIGGVVIVPALVLLGGLEIHRAIATSLPVIFVIGLSAVSAHFLGGQRVPPDITTLFVLGGAVGMIGGMRIGKRLSAPRLQQVFAAAMLAVVAFIIARMFF